MTYQEQRRRLLEDLQGKLFREDWHGVADAACDLRELDAREKGREEAAAEHGVAKP